MSPVNIINTIRPSSTFESFRKVEGTEEAYNALYAFTEKLMASQDRLAKEAYPFAHAQLVTLTGPVGTGKTHLLEAIVNQLRPYPGILKRVSFVRKDVYYAYQLDQAPFGQTAILLWDDFLSDHQTLAEYFRLEFQAQALMQFFVDTYENRRVVIMNSNFSMEALAEVVKKWDKIGRATSRINEMLANGKKIAIQAPDYRLTLAKQASDTLLF